MSDIARLEIGGGSRHAFELQVELHTDDTNILGTASKGNAKRSKSSLHEFSISREFESKVLQ